METYQAQPTMDRKEPLKARRVRPPTKKNSVGKRGLRMPRLPRIHLEDALYYVTSQGLHNEKIFKDDGDYKAYLNFLLKYKEQYQFKLFAYSLFPDRLHLLIETGSKATISEILHDLNTAYTKYFNARYDRRGPLFEPRFRSALVEKQNYLLKMTGYIHEISRECVYGSFQAYTVRPEGAGPVLKLETEVAEVVSLLKDKEAGAYERYCLAVEPSQTRELKKKLSRGGVLGSDIFVEEVKNRIQQQSTEKEEIKPVLGLATKYFLSAVGVVLLATVLLVFYLYKGQAELRAQYEGLLWQKDAEYSREARFENRSPLAPTELEGTAWEVEMISKSAKEKVTQDTFSFHEGRFMSEALKANQFRFSGYFLVPQGAGKALWQSTASKPDGVSAAWSGEWSGGVMKGTLILNQQGKSSEFSFYSKKWRYLGAGHEKK